MFLLDTVVLSELEKPRPNAGLVDWLESVDWLDLHLSAISVGELWKGILKLPPGRKRQTLEAMFQMLPERFFNRIIPVDEEIAMKFAELQAQHGPLPTLDAFIAATALNRHLTLITRNIQDMASAGVTIINPWS